MPREATFCPCFPGVRLGLRPQKTPLLRGFFGGIAKCSKRHGGERVAEAHEEQGETAGTKDFLEDQVVVMGFWGFLWCGENSIFFSTNGRTAL